MLCSILFFASCKFDEPVREYFEYWSSTCQVGKIEYASENVTIDNVPNLSAIDFIDIDVYTINPQNFTLLLNPSNGSSFSFQNESGNLSVSEYSETMIDPTYIKIRAKLSDESEGQLITLSGCLWPENRTAFSEADLRVQSPELFYTTSFIQNTPPDNIKNLQRAEDFFPGTQKCYIAFEVPDQSLNRNRDSTYEVKYFFRNDDNSLELKGSKILTLADNKNPTSGSNVFMYYFEGQLDDFLTRYEYTVQVTGPRGLTADIRSTDPALGACVLVESAITVLDAPNGLYDEDSDGDYECYELESEGDSITFTVDPGQEGDTLTVTDNGTVLTPTNGNTYTVSGLGRHEIRATSSRTDAFSVTVKKRLRISTTPNPATFTFSQDFNGLKDESDPNNVVEYTEVDEPDSTVTYSISPTDEGTTVSGNVDGTNYTNTVSGPLEIGLHKLVSIIHKEYCQPVTLVRNIMVARKLQEPEYTFNPPLNENTVDGYEYLEVTSSTEKADYTIKPSSADNNAKVSVKINNGTAYPAAEQSIGQLSTDFYTLKVTVSKDYMTPREFTRKIRVDSKLTKPEITCTDLNGKKDYMGYEYIEVDDSNSTASYTVTNKDSRTGDTSVTTVVTAMPDNTTVSTYNSGQLDTGTPGSPKKYKIVSTVKKDGYVDQTTTKLVAVVTKLKTPKIEFGKDFNGTGKDSSGYLYIEVPDSTTTVSYTSSSDDNSGSNNPVTVSTKIGGWANPNTGTLNTNIGEYDITVTASCAFQNDATFTTKVKVVQELQEPNYLFTPGLTSESEDKWIEVPKTDHNVSCKITAKASDEKIKVTEGGTTLYNTGSSPANFTLNTLGDHTLSVTVSRANYISKTFSKSVTIVEELQEPNYSFTPGLTSESNGKWIEVPSTDHNVICKITAQNSEESLTVRDNSTSIYSPANFTISSLVDHTLSVTVSRANYKSRTFSKTVKIVEELQEPTIRFYKHDGNDVLSESSSAPEESCYSDYTCYDLPLTTSGTGNANFEVYPGSGESVVVKIDGTEANANSSGKRTLALGPHTIEFTVKKTNYKDLLFTKKVYIQGELADPKISPNNGTFDSGSGNTSSDPMVYQFSYISYDSMKLKFEPGNSNSGGTSTSLSWKINDLDGTNTTGIQGIGVEETVKIEIKQTRQYCKTKTTTKYAKGIIKPIKLTYKNNKAGNQGWAGLYICSLGTDKYDLLGSVTAYRIGSNDSLTDGKTVWAYGEDKYGITANTWDHLHTDSDGRTVVYTLTKTTDKIALNLTDLRRRNHDGEGKISGTVSRSLSDIKSGKGLYNETNSYKKENWTLYTGKVDSNGKCAEVYIKFVVSD
ncbi:MAG: hypothetical protein IKQ66_00880 [Treponema sp.]|nr:hypothetical protein [Treponema sp.]